MKQNNRSLKTLLLIIIGIMLCNAICYIQPIVSVYAEENTYYDTQEKRQDINDKFLELANYIPIDSALNLSQNQKEYQEVFAKANELTQNCSSDYEKITIIHDWIGENIYYDYDYFEGRSSSTYIEAYEVFRGKRTVCAGYTSLFVVMSRAVGIPAIVVAGCASGVGFNGWKNEEDANHAWNMVYIDGSWKSIDVTWDSGNAYSNGSFSKGVLHYSYFLIDINKFSDDHLITDLGSIDGKNHLYYSAQLSKGEITMILTGSNKNVTEVTIPNSVFNCKVTKSYIDFNKYPNIKKVTIETTWIPDFTNATSIEEVILPDTMEEIKGWAFLGCTSLKTVALPVELKTIGNGAFEGCTSLKNITLPNGLESIKFEAFSGCISLEKVTLSNKEGDASLKNATLSTELRSIGPNAFSGCTSLKTVILPNNIISIENKAFFGCTSLENITLPTELVSIKHAAFDGCTLLKNITLPSKLVIMESYAFYGCISLENVTFTSKLSRIENNTFSNCTALKTIILPNEVRSIGEFAFAYCTSLENVTLPAELRTIELKAFEGCTSLKSITLPNKLSEIGNAAFADTQLTSITFPSSLKLMDDSILWGIETLSHVEFLGKKLPVIDEGFATWSSGSWISPYTSFFGARIDTNICFLTVPVGTKKQYKRLLLDQEYSNLIVLEKGETKEVPVTVTPNSYSAKIIVNYGANYSNCTYSLDGIKYQKSATFKNLLPGTTYKLSLKAGNEKVVSKTFKTKSMVTVKKSGTTYSANITAQNGYEYSLDGKKWSTNCIFTKLSKGNYTAYTRKIGTKKNSDIISEAFVIK